MTNRLVKESKATYTPGVRPKPGRAAYCITTTRQVQETVQVAAPVYGYLTVTNPDPLFGTVSNTLQYTVSPGSYRSVTRTEATTVCFPEIPGVEGFDGYVAINNLVGWNAGAGSINSQAGDLLASFQFPASVSGAICGLAASASIDFNAVQHGIYATTDEIAIYESGRRVFTSQHRPSDKPLLQIRRHGNRVSYQIGNDRYDSLEASSGTKVLLGVLYAAGDNIESPVLAALDALSSGEGLRLQGTATLGGGTSTGQVGLSSAGALGIKGSALVFDATRGDGAAPIVEVAGLQGFTPFGMGGTGSTIYIDSCYSEIPVRMRASESGNHAGVNRSRSALDFVCVGLETPDPLSYNMVEPLLVNARYSAPIELLSVVYERLDVGMVFDLLMSLDTTLFEGLFLQETFSVSVLLEQILRERLTVSDDVRSARQLALQYASNLASGGVARYQGFDFQGFARVGLDAYAYRADGVYRIGADGDDGRALQALVDFGTEDFGTSQLKRGDTLYLGLATDGEVVAQLSVDGDRDYTYRVQGQAPTLRAELGRGLTSKLWQLRLQVTDATEVDLDGVEWIVATSARKLTR